MKKKVYRRRRKPRRRKWPLVILVLVLLAGILVAASVVFGYNPFLESRLRSQFGDAFFTDFGVSVEKDTGADLESIVEAYEPAFEELEARSLERLESLYQSALEEYRDQEKDGTVDRFVLTSKYIQAGRMLEKNVDETFYDLLAEMEATLIQGGHSTDIIADIEATYEQAKAEKKRQLMQKLRQEIDE